MASPEIPAWLNSSKLPNFPITAFFLIFFGTWFTEDGALLASALLWKKGKLGWELVYWANVLGVTAGDILLYYIGFELSKGLQTHWARRFISAELMEKGRTIFKKWGYWLVLLARCVPGLRIPAYAASGLLNIPLAPFSAIIFLSALFWVFFQMKLVEAAGNHFNAWQIACLALAVLALTQWTLKGFDEGGWRRRWNAVKRLFGLGPRDASR